MRDTARAKPVSTPSKPKPKSQQNPKAIPKAKAKPRPQARSAEPTRRRRFVPALLAVTLIGLLFGFVYPTRTFLDQRTATSDAHTRLELLQSENAKLAGESKLLSSDAEIERLARERYGLVKSGEKAFVIVPAPTTTLPPTTLPPTTRPQTTSQSSATTNSGPSRHP